MMDRRSFFRTMIGGVATVAGVSLLSPTIETEREEDGRWIAEIPECPGALAYGSTESEARWHAYDLRGAVVTDDLLRKAEAEQLRRVEDLRNHVRPSGNTIVANTDEFLEAVRSGLVGDDVIRRAEAAYPGELREAELALTRIAVLRDEIKANARGESLVEFTLRELREEKARREAKARWEDLT